MVNEPYLPPEAKAYQSFLNWLNEGHRVRILFEQEGIELPATLALTLSEKTEGNSGVSQKIATIKPPSRPDMPPKASHTWLWINAKDAMIKTLFLAILNEGKVLPIKIIISEMKKIIPDLIEGSVYNVPGPLEGKLIEKTASGWKLKDGQNVPILYGNYVWGMPEWFQKQDIAAFRRMVIMHLLEMNTDGLQTVQIYKRLQTAKWLNTPKTKDLIKTDLLVMEKEGKVRRLRGKWILEEIKPGDKKPA